MDLLGYTLKEINELYDKIKYDYSCCGIQILLSFESFSNVIKTININRINTPMLAIETDKINICSISLPYKLPNFHGENF